MTRITDKIVKEAFAMGAKIVSLKDEVENLKAVLRSIQWLGSEDEVDMCPCCGGFKEDGHAMSCEIAKALT